MMVAPNGLDPTYHAPKAARDTLKTVVWWTAAATLIGLILVFWMVA